jgi:tRNA threonylcarbamoyl adenosine modification protein YjeE
MPENLLECFPGAGKTTVCRGFIRELCRSPDMVVTSPTYLLDNIYDYARKEDSVMKCESRGVIHHMDLYRLPKNCDASILGIPAVFEASISLVEWPHRLADWEASKMKYVSAAHRLDVRITIAKDAVSSVGNDMLQTRSVLLTSYDEIWRRRIHAMLQDSDFNLSS